MSKPDFTLYRLIVIEAPVGIIFANRDRIIELWNPAAEAVFGYNSDEAVGQTWTYHPHDLERLTGEVIERR